MFRAVIQCLLYLAVPKRKLDRGIAKGGETIATPGNFMPRNTAQRIILQYLGGIHLHEASRTGEPIKISICIPRHLKLTRPPRVNPGRSAVGGSRSNESQTPFADDPGRWDEANLPLKSDDPDWISLDGTRHDRSTEKSECGHGTGNVPRPGQIRPARALDFRTV